MRRGELWIGASHSDYGNKPRPVLIVQADGVRAFDSIIACPLTSVDAGASTLRLPLGANLHTGLTKGSWVMIEKITAYGQKKLSRRIGFITALEMELVDAALLDLMGLRR